MLKLKAAAEWTRRGAGRSATRVDHIGDQSFASLGIPWIPLKHVNNQRPYIYRNSHIILRNSRLSSSSHCKHRAPVLAMEESQSASGKYLAEHYADDVAKLQKYVIYGRRVYYFFLFVVFTNVVLTYFLIMHPSRLPCKPNAELCAACAEANPAWTDLLTQSIWGKVSTAISSTLIICWVYHSYRYGPLYGIEAE